MFLIFLFYSVRSNGQSQTLGSESDQNPVALNDTLWIDEDESESINLLINDSSRIDGAIRLLSANNPLKGTIQIIGDSTILYSPEFNFFGIDSLKYVVKDVNNNTGTAWLYIFIDPVNDAPVANKDSAETLEDTPLIIDVLANDADVDSEILSIVELTLPSHGSAEISSGQVVYFPNENYSGTDSFEYTISDGELTSSAVLSITVQPVNDPPVAEDDFISTYEDTPVEINILLNDSDVEQQSLEIEFINLPKNGTVELTNKQIVRYSPLKDFNGSDSLTYKCIDPIGASSQAVVYIENVIPVNDKPVALMDQFTLNEDEALEFDPLQNDYDVDGDIVFLEEVSTPDHGKLVTLDNGNLKYVPDLNYNGNDSITYSVSDRQSESVSSFVIFNVLPVNDPPTANSDFISVVEDTRKFVNVLDNDNDVDNENLTLNGVVKLPLHGIVKMIGNQLEYFPNLNYIGKDSLCYSVKDNSGSTAEAWVIVHQIIPVNDPPIANDDFVNTLEDTPINISVLVNDKDVDGDELYVQSVTQPVNGMVEVLPDNNVKYSPKSNYFGSDQFEYTVSDSLGETAKALVYIQSIEPVNDAPFARDDFASTKEDEKVKIHVLENDSDIDEDKISIISIGQPVNGKTKIDKGSKIEYDPDKDFNGLDKFWYAIEDLSKVVDTAWVTVYVGEVNDSPVSNFDWVSMEEDNSISVNVLENDYDPDGDPLEVIEITTPFHGSASVVNSSTIKYTSNFNYNGKDSIQYTVYDGNGNTDIEWLFITITPVNDAPLAISDYVIGLEDSVVSIIVLDNDSDPDGDHIIIESWTNGEFGEVVNDSGSLIYIPDENFNGTDQLIYTISDGELTNSAEVFITIQNSNDPPVAVNDSIIIFEDQQVIISVLDNDIDVDGDSLQLSIVEEPAEGSVTIQDDKLLYIPAKDFEGIDRLRYEIDDNNGGKAEANVILIVNGVSDAPVAINDYVYIPEDSLIKVDVLSNDFDIEGSSLEIVSYTNPENGEVSLENNKLLKYVPKLNFNGKDTILYSISDNEGLKDSALLVITLFPVNDTPTANDDFFTVKEEESTLLNPLLNDIDVDQDFLTISSHSNARNGTVSLASNKIRYTPDNNFVGKDTIEYTITDPFGESGSAIIFIQVMDENDPPTAYDDFYTVNEDDEIVLTLLENDTDPENDELSIKSFSSPINGDVYWDNEVLMYEPSLNYFGSDSLLYLVYDGEKTDTAWVYFTILPVNDAPVAQNINIKLAEDESFNIDCNDFVNDVDSENLHLTFWSQASKGLLIQKSDLSLFYVSEKDEYGKDLIQYMVTDGELYTDTAFIFIEIYPVNDVPVALNDTVKGLEDTPIIIDVLENDSDVEGSELSILSLSNPNNGNVVINSDKSITYTPNANFSGFDEFSYTIIDDNGAKNSAKVVINKIEPVNDLPVAIADTFFIPGLEVISGNLLLNDFDVDNDEILVTQILHSPSKGELLNYSNGDFEYKPDSTANGTDSFTYEISDGSVTAQAVVVIVYTSTSHDVSLSVNEGEELAIDLKDYTFAEAKLYRLLQNQKNGILKIASDSSTLQYIPSAGFVGSDHVKILVCKTDVSTTCVFLNLYLEVLPREELLIYQVITPNNDGYNDFWHIEGIKAYPDNKVEVFDMEGNLVYSETGYDNENKRWAGEFGSKETGGGTFIYFIDLGTGTTFNGTLLIAY